MSLAFEVPFWDGGKKEPENKERSDWVKRNSSFKTMCAFEREVRKEWKLI